MSFDELLFISIIALTVLPHNSKAAEWKSHAVSNSPYTHHRAGSTGTAEDSDDSLDLQLHHQSQDPTHATSPANVIAEAMMQLCTPDDTSAAESQASLSPHELSQVHRHSRSDVDAEEFRRLEVEMEVDVETESPGKLQGGSACSDTAATRVTPFIHSPPHCTQYETDAVTTSPITVLPPQESIITPPTSSIAQPLSPSPPMMRVRRTHSGEMRATESDVSSDGEGQGMGQVLLEVEIEILLPTHMRATRTMR